MLYSANFETEFYHVTKIKQIVDANFRLIKVMFTRARQVNWLKNRKQNNAKNGKITFMTI